MIIRFRRRLAAILVIAGIAFAPPPAAAAPGKGELAVAAVQLSISADDLASLEVFSARIERLVLESMAFEPDLIVFPEYTSAFIALIPAGEACLSAPDLASALAALQKREPLARSVRDLFLLNAGYAERALETLFGGLARCHGVAILAGSFFARRQEGEGRGGLANRAILFDKEGKRAYSQDKVFLTEFEEEELELEPGRIEEARGFELAGRRVALTICRDTFFTDWEERFRGADLWIDIKANGEPYSQKEAESFERALPERIRSGACGLGLTVCLNGRLLDFLWEGESSLVQGAGPGASRSLLRAHSAGGEEILAVRIAKDGIDVASRRR